MKDTRNTEQSRKTKLNIDNNHQYYKTLTNSIREFCTFLEFQVLNWVNVIGCYIQSKRYRPNGLNRKRLRAIYDFSYRFEEFFFFISKKKDREKLDCFDSFTTGSTGIKTSADDREYCDQIDIKSLIVQFNLFQMRKKREKNNFNHKLVLCVFFLLDTCNLWTFVLHPILLLCLCMNHTVW